MKRTSAVVLTIALGLTGSVGAPSLWAQPAKNQAWKETVGKAKISILDAIKTAEATFAGGKAVWVKLTQSKGEAHWQVLVLNDKQLSDVRINAGKGDVISNEPVKAKGSPDFKASRYEDINAASVTLSQAITTAMGTAEGSKVFSAKFTQEKGKPVYAVWLMAGKKTAQVGVDPGTGEVISNLEKAGPKGDLLADASVGLSKAVDVATQANAGYAALGASFETKGATAFWRVIVAKQGDLKEVRVDPSQGSVLSNEEQKTGGKGKGENNSGTNRDELIARTKVSFSQAVDKAVAEVPGSKAYAAALKMQGGNPVYRVDVVENGKGTRIMVDGVSGAILGHDDVDPESETEGDGKGG